MPAVAKIKLEVPIDSLFTGQEIQALLFLIEQTNDRFVGINPLAKELELSSTEAWMVLLSAKAKLRMKGNLDETQS